MKYADDRKARFVALIGESEMEKGVVLLKNMQSGEQQEMNVGVFIAMDWV